MPHPGVPVLHNLIIIDDYGGGNYTWEEALLQSWCSGSGTVGDPYTIEISIDPEDKSGCMEIWNSTAYVTIQNSYFQNSKASDTAIIFKNTTNIKLVDNSIYSNEGTAIMLINSHYTNISFNFIQDNGQYIIYRDAVRFFNSHNSTIIGNSISRSGSDGIEFTNCTNIIIRDNVIASSGRYGLKTSVCSNISVVDNVISGNGLAIGLYTSDNNNLTENYINSYDVGIDLINSKNNYVSFNTILTTYDSMELIDRVGIALLSDSNYNNITENTISGDFEAGIWCRKSHYNSITQNKIKHATEWGLGLYQSNYNNVTRNILTDNKVCIEEDECIGNIIEDNTCRTEGIPGYSIVFLIGSLSIISTIILFLNLKKVIYHQQG